MKSFGFARSVTHIVSVAANASLHMTAFFKCLRSDLCAAVNFTAERCAFYVKLLLNDILYAIIMPYHNKIIARHYPAKDER